MKICSTCKEEKEKSNYRINNKNTGALRSQCKDCERAYGRKYNRQNKHIRDRWMKNNLDKFHKLQADYYQRTKGDREIRNANRYQTDKAYKTKMDMKRKYQQDIKTNIHFRKWLEFNFTKEMSWKNYSTFWEIDHVIPICQWNLLDPEQVELCYDWKNTRPCLKDHNMNKKEKILYYEIYEQREQLKKYMITAEQIKELSDYMNLYYYKHLYKFYIRELWIKKIKENLKETGETGYLQDILLRELPESLEYNPQLETIEGDQE